METARKAQLGIAQETENCFSIIPQVNIRETDKEFIQIY
jgi:hypothetical protein